MSLLDKEVHKHLIADQERYATMAGISVQMLGQSAKGYLTPTEIDWLRGIKPLLKNGQANYCFVGPQKVSIHTKMMAITGCLLRNFIDARVMPLLNVLEDEESALTPTVLLIPDFYTAGSGDKTASMNKPLPAWQIPRLHSVLLSRMVSNKGTIVYASHLEKVKDCYGPGIDDLIQNHYTLGE